MRRRVLAYEVSRGVWRLQMLGVWDGAMGVMVQIVFQAHDGWIIIQKLSFELILFLVQSII